MARDTEGAADASIGPVGPPVDGPAARRPTHGEVLEGRHVRLEPVDPDRHADRLFAHSHGPGHEALWRYLMAAPAPDAAAFRAYLEAAAARPDPVLYAIVDLATGEAVGHAAFMRIEPAHRVIEIGNILFTPRLQRSAAASEVIFLMLRHAFEDLGDRRVEWKCDALNAPSRRAAERYGFAYEGLFRQHLIVKGRSRDTTWFAMLDGDWPARKAAFERWLAPGNFDADGRQRLGLSDLNARAIPGFLDLRRAGIEDAAPYEGLQRAAYAWNRTMLGVEPVPLLTPVAEVLARYETWLLEDEHGLAGALALEPFPDHLVIWSVSVDPSRQNAGIGRRLLEASEARARALGLSTMRLFTGAPLQKNIDWYHRRGYETERIEDLADRRLVHMIKTISR